VGALAAKLTQLEQQRAVARPTDNAEAYDLVLRARALLRRDQRLPNREARALLARAEAMAPDFAEVWITLGEAEWARAAFGWVEDVEDRVRRAEELALRALQSPDPRVHARAHSLMATLRTHTGQADEALQHTERAIAINPSDTSALFRHAHALLAAGRPEESIPIFETGLRYDPRPGIGPPSQLAAAYFAARRYQDVISFTQLALAVRPDSFALHAHRAAAYAELGRIGDARREADEVRRLNPAFRVESAGTRLRPEHAAQLRSALAKAGL
jgi:adenylate cyclase